MTFRKIKKFLIQRFKINRELFLDLKLMCFKVTKSKKFNKFLIDLFCILRKIDHNTNENRNK